MSQPVGAAEYFELFPSGDHRPGDIWTPLPTNGVLVHRNVAGLVVTPACDLANRKVETISYLPVIPVREYLASRAFLGDVLRAVSGQLTNAGLQAFVEKDSPLPPPIADLEAALELLQQYLSATRLGEKERIAGNRAHDGLKLAIAALLGRCEDDVMTKMRSLLGEKELGLLLRRIVTNGYRADIHFVPADGQPATWSAIREHSVALFRYPLTLPIDLLDIANSTTVETWALELDRWSAMYPCCASLTSARPLKSLRIRVQFMSDLLTRFTNLYGRLGSPDFAPTVVERFSKEIGDE
jgi:hypothetical protein